MASIETVEGNLKEYLEGARCMRCGRAYKDATDIELWNMDCWHGYLMGVICPDCQTDSEDMEAQVNEATFDYSNAEPLKVFASRDTLNDEKQEG